MNSVKGLENLGREVIGANSVHLDVSGTGHRLPLGEINPRFIVNHGNLSMTYDVAIEFNDAVYVAKDIDLDNIYSRGITLYGSGGEGLGSVNLTFNYGSMDFGSVYSDYGASLSFQVTNDLYGVSIVKLYTVIPGLEAVGTDIPEVIYGSESNDTVSAENGNDIIHGLLGGDILRAGAGDDKVDGGEDDDEIFGDDGTDQLTGDAGNDTLWGSPGNDELVGGSGDDAVYGGGGDDLLADYTEDYYDNNKVSGSDIMYGNAGDDTIYYNSGGDTIIGGYGNDSIYSGYSNDYHYGKMMILRGGRGDDIITGIGIFDPDAILKVYGGTGNDSISASSDTNYIFGGDGDDAISFGSNNHITGGEGNDVFAFEFLSTATHHIRDFTQGEDTIDVSFLGKTLSVHEGAATGSEIGFTYDYNNSSTTIDIKYTSNEHFDMRVILDGAIALTDSDFIL